MPPKQARNKIGQYDLIQKFPGYRAREDQTKLDPSFMVAPSQNVVINTAGRVSLVKGYVLDGTGSATADSGILSNFDFSNFKGDVRNLRAGFLTSAANDGKLQYRYKDALGVINWIDLMTGLTNVRLSYTEYWDNSALVKDVLWVDGTNNIFVWNGSVTTLASATVNTVTKQDSTKTWAQEGFSATGSITIGGVTATYSGGYGTQTLTGVSVDFSNTGTYPVASIVHQTPVTSALSGMTSILATFAPTVIGCGRANQVFLGASNSNNLYISKVNTYTDYSFTTPTRVVGEGALIPLDSYPVAFISSEDRNTSLGGLAVEDMYISEGTGHWGIIRSILSSDLTKETLQHVRMMVSPQQGAISRRLVGKMKNHIMFVSNDNVAQFFGIESFKNVPESVDFSYTIVDDMKSYDFTDGQIYYFSNYIYITVPKSGLIRIFNMTNQTKQTTQSPSFYKTEDIDENQPWFWEAPVTYPISGIYWTPDKGLCGHSYTTSESYQLFIGGSFNGQDIDANATFAFDDKGDRTQSKGSDECWVEGYLKQNSLLNLEVKGDLDNCQSSQTTVIDGSNKSVVCYGGGAHALGTKPIGVEPLGGTNISPTLPAWFHGAFTYPQVPFYLEQLSFSNKGIDQDFQIICFGTNSLPTVEGNNSITI